VLDFASLGPVLLEREQQMHSQNSLSMTLSSLGHTGPGPPKEKTQKNTCHFLRRLVRETKTMGQQKLEVRKTKTIAQQAIEVRHNKNTFVKYATWQQKHTFPKVMH